MLNQSPRLDDSGFIHVLRESSCNGPWVLIIEIDGRDYARLSKGQTQSIRVAPGKHRVKARPWGMASNSVPPEEGEFAVDPQGNVDLVVRCDRGGGLFKKLYMTLEERRWRGLVRMGGDPPPERAVDWSSYRFDVTEVETVVEPAGSTSHIEDNSMSDVPSTHKITVENEWTRTIVVSGESQMIKGFAAGLGVGWLTLSAQVESSLCSQFSIQQGERRTVKQEVEVLVPAGSRLTITVHWKLAWRKGYVTIVGPGGQTIVPYQFIQNVDFDRYTVSS